MKYFMRKIFGFLITLVIISVLIFFAFELIPGDPAIQRLGTEATEISIQNLREEMGLNRPAPVRYASWVIGLFTGDLGESFSFQIPVQDMLLDKLPITITITLLSFFMILILSIPISMLCARYRSSLLDTIILSLNQITMSVPAFFVGMLFTFLFGILLRWFVPGGYVSYQVNVWEFLSYLILPSFAIALPRAAMTSKILRNSLIEELNKDYVRTSLSRGSTLTRVLVFHALKNGFLPIITFLGLTLADIVTNSIIIERVFGIPGLGSVFLSSIANRDYPVVKAIIFFLGVFILLLNLSADLLYAKLDKRIDV